MAALAPQRFRARVRRQGPNPYVDVPDRVSRAFASLAHAGRIQVVGTLNGTSIRGTLIPARRDRHRFYVNGGMRAATGVAVGDTASFQLRATAPGIVRPPSDVAAALRRVTGARAAFEALAPSHRRELLRYVDDARTPETRGQRIQKTVDHVLGRESATTARGNRGRSLWTCPTCGNQFVNRNQYHSCKRYALSEPFRGKPEFVRDLFDRFRSMIRANGPVKVLPYRDKVGFMVRVRFAGAIPRSQWLDLAFWLTRRIQSKRFHKIETLDPNAHIHLLRITDPHQLDAEVEGWIREAYAVGRQEHLGG